ncbi:MAG: Autotransporter beta-domain protein [Ignavibacteriae bacterium]|nr:MAG: Autotransporter beta-domain protein [Ignavibacteriota bacterium]
MKTVIRVLIAFLFIAGLMEIASAQSPIDAGEYFIDTDPGLGNGTQLISSDGNFNEFFEEFNITIPTSSLSEGVHTLYVRLKNKDNSWGNVLAKPFIVRDESAFFVHLPPRLTNAEYFVDADPGEGNGVALNAVDGDFNGVFENVLGTLNTSTMDEGAHSLFVRFRNSEGNWGKAIAKPFIVRDESAFFVHLPPGLTNAEYFIDADPGEGNGVALNAVDGDFNGVFENVLGTLNTSTMDEGAHSLFVRIRNSEGNWGKAIAKPFIVRDESAFFVHLPPKITNAEYFVDTDPGEGNGVALNAVDGDFNGVFENVLGTLNTSTLDEGAHSLFVRFRNSEGNWGKAIAKPFIVRDESAFFVHLPPRLTNAEYFVNADPGEGNGVALNAVDGDFNGVFENVLGTLNTSTMDEGAHSLFVRIRNSEGNWGKAIAKPFVVRDESAFFVHLPPRLTNAEYFVDTDPGASNGIQLKASDGSFDQFIENVFDTLKTTSLTEDVHAVGMRFLESNGNWSKPFYSIIEIANVTPPSQPSGLTATGRNRKTILKWFKNPDHDIANYILYRSLIDNFTPDSTNLLTTVSKNDTVYIDRNLENGTPYYYRLKAMDVANLYSEASEQVEVIPFNTPPGGFSLEHPANGDTLSNVTEPVKFVWQSANDVDEDTLFYILRIQGVNIDTTISDIYDTTFNFDGKKLFIKNSIYTWFVNVTDGTEWTVSQDTFVFVTPDFVGVKANPVPSKFVLYQNYPNPFNPTTTISFELPERMEVVLKIYDILGNEIITLFSGTLESGYHSVTWDGKNENGQAVASGIYLYRLKSSESSSTLKLLILK